MKKYELGSVKGFVLISIGALLVVGSLFYLWQHYSSGSADGVTSAASSKGAIDLEAAMAPRILGDETAPARIVEFSSLSCGHCAKFHASTLLEIKEKYIDTGKAHVQFTDFPLNRPALDATMVARCLPADQYFAFTEKLFAEQESWAFDQGYVSKLRGYAKEHGMSDSAFKACLASDELRQAIVDRMQAAQKQWNVSSTPTFVINNDPENMVVGAQPLEAFEPGLTKVLTAQ